MSKVFITFPRNQSDIFKVIILPNRQPETQRHFIYCKITKKSLKSSRLWSLNLLMFNIFPWRMTKKKKQVAINFLLID